MSAGVLQARLEGVRRRTTSRTEHIGRIIGRTGDCGGDEPLKSLEFEAGVSSQRLKRLFPGLLWARGPLLQEYEHHNPCELAVVDEQEARAEYYPQQENAALAK